MPAVTTDSIFSATFYRSLVLEPLYQESVVLRALRRIEIATTTAYLPRVTGGSVSWVPEATEIPDSGALVDLVAVTPQKVAALAIVSNEAVGDANAASMLGELRPCRCREGRRRVLPGRRRERSGRSTGCLRYRDGRRESFGRSRRVD